MATDRAKPLPGVSELENAAKTAHVQLVNLMEGPNISRPNPPTGNIPILSSHQDAANFGPDVALFTMMSIISNYLPPVTPEPEKLADKPNETSPWVQGLVNAIIDVKRLDPLSALSPSVSTPYIQPFQPTVVPGAIAPLDLPSLAQVVSYQPAPTAIPVPIPTVAQNPTEVPTEPAVLAPLPTSLYETFFLQLGQVDGLDLQTLDISESVNVRGSVKTPSKESPVRPSGINPTINPVVQQAAAPPESIAFVTEPVQIPTVAPQTELTVVESKTVQLYPQPLTPSPLSAPIQEITRQQPVVRTETVRVSAISEVVRTPVASTNPIAPVKGVSTPVVSPQVIARPVPIVNRPTIAPRASIAPLAARSPITAPLPIDGKPVVRPGSATTVVQPAQQEGSSSIMQILDQAKLDDHLQMERMFSDDLIELAILRQQELNIQKQAQKSDVANLTIGIPPAYPVPIIKGATIVKGEIDIEITVNGKDITIDLGSASVLNDPKQLAALENQLLATLKAEYDKDGSWTAQQLADLLTAIEQAVSKLPLPPSKDPVFSNTAVLCSPISLTV